MNNGELKQNVDLLKERVEKLRDSHYKLKANALRKECNSLGEAIRECLPILGRAREERSTALAFLNTMGYFGVMFPELKQTSQPIVDSLNGPLVDSLNRFAVAHEDWQKVESYAEEETERDDIELHVMAVKAWRIGCTIERKRFEFEAKQRALPTSEQFIVHDDYRMYSSAFGLTQGVHFFETVVLGCSFWESNQKFQIGWGTRLWRDGFGEWIGGEKHLIDKENSLQCTYDPVDDQHSIGFDGSYPTGTVLGCLLDFTQRTFVFYVNGRKVIFEKLPFSSNAYYVQTRGDLLYFNFGQVPFKYPPPELADFPTTDLAKQASRYTLYRRVTLMPFFENQVEPYYTDAKQGKVKGTFEQLWMNGDITREKVAEKYAQLWKEEIFNWQTYGGRWMQAILEMENVDEREVNDWAILVEMMVDFNANKCYLLESFLLPYSKLLQMVGDRWTMYLTVAILFAILLQYRLYELNSAITLGITSSLRSFLHSAFLCTTDPSTAMFTLIGLETVKEEEEEGIESPIMQELKSNKFTEKLKEWKGKIENTRKMNPSLAQLHLVIKHFEHSLQSSSAPHPVTPTSLSPSACML